MVARVHREDLIRVRIPALRMKPKLIIFDFWKTLAYSPKKDPKEFYSSLPGFGIEITGKEDIKHFSSSFSKLMCFSKNWEDFSQQLLQKFSKKQGEENITELANFLRENIAYRIYDDVKEVLDLPYAKAILTDSARFLVENSELKDLGRIFTPAETKALKPDSRVFLTVINEFKIKAEEAVMVGDDIERDLVPAKNLGIKPVLIDRENKFQDYQGIRINSFKELKKLLEND